MTSLEETAPAFVAMAHSIVWASVATVDNDGHLDDDTCATVWGKVAVGPEPAGYDRFIIIPVWADGPASRNFVVLRLTPCRSRVMVGAVLTQGQGAPLTRSDDSGRLD